MSDNDNIVEFPTKGRKDEVAKDRAKKVTDYTSPSYNLNSITFSSTGYEHWNPDSLDDVSISFSKLEDTKWVPSFGPTDTNLLTAIVDRCAAIQKQCITAGADQATITLQHVLDKLDEALLLSKISLK